MRDRSARLFVLTPLCGPCGTTVINVICHNTRCNDNSVVRRSGTATNMTWHTHVFDAGRARSGSAETRIRVRAAPLLVDTRSIMRDARSDTARTNTRWRGLQLLSYMCMSCALSDAKCFTRQTAACASERAMLTPPSAMQRPAQRSAA